MIFIKWGEIHLTKNFFHHQEQRKCWIDNSFMITITCFKIKENSLYWSTILQFRFLAEKYLFTKSHLGEQDWFNLLQFESPNLIYVIPCQYNLQLDISYQKQELFKVSLCTIWLELYDIWNICIFSWNSFEIIFKTFWKDLFEMYHTCYKKGNKEKEILGNSHVPMPKDITSDVKVSDKTCDKHLEQIYKTKRYEQI